MDELKESICSCPEHVKAKWFGTDVSFRYVIEGFGVSIPEVPDKRDMMDAITEVCPFEVQRSCFYVTWIRCTHAIILVREACWQHAASALSRRNLVILESCQHKESVLMFQDISKVLQGPVSLKAPDIKLWVFVVDAGGNAGLPEEVLSPPICLH